jgi:glycosyltransferase involved in cell wall biosynthesis
MPRATVIIPAFRAEATLAAAVESALAQTFGDLEVVVVDDASPVPVAETLAGIGDERLRVVRHERNRGTATARNSAVRLGSAPIVAQLDADDRWEPEYLAAVLPPFDDPSVGLVYANGTLVEPDGESRALYAGADCHPIASFDELAAGNVLRVPGVTIRRRALEAIGGYPAGLRHCADWFVYLELLHGGWRFAHVPDRLFYYRVPDYGAHWYGKRELDRDELRMWGLLAVRHPRLVAHRQLRWRVRRELMRLVAPR